VRALSGGSTQRSTGGDETEGLEQPASSRIVSSSHHLGQLTPRMLRQTAFYGVSVSSEVDPDSAVSSPLHTIAKYGAISPIPPSALDRHLQERVLREHFDYGT
jgi:hypothetical protein